MALILSAAAGVPASAQTGVVAGGPAVLEAASGVELATGAQGAHLLFYAPSGGPRTLVAAGEQTVQEPAVVRFGGTVAVTWQSGGEPYYAVSYDGGRSFGRALPNRHELMLRYAEFDPLVDGQPQVPVELMARAEQGLWVVQYVTKGLEPWREAIRALGGVDQRFLANNANIWRMDVATAARVAELPFVRWVGEFHPAYKLENELLEAFLTDSLETRRYRLVVGEWGPREKALVAGQVREIGGRVEQQIDEGWILEATLSPAQMLEIVHQGEVLGIDRWGEPEEDMNIVRSVMGADYIESVAGYDGTGVRAEVMDSGLETGRADWTYPPIQHGTVTFGSHGTSTYSINFANGASNINTRGLVPDAQGIVASYIYYGGNRYLHTQQLVSSPYFAVYQSNSWGDARTTQYTSISQQMDDIIYINDIVITQSQSNAGNQDSRPQAWAKNIVAVGGIRHYNDTNSANDNWNFGASTGPAADGRIKPDMSAYYDSVWVVNSTSFGGTSAASPIVAGHLGLIHEMWHNGIFGNPTGATVFDSRPHSTLARALLINNAWQWPYNQTDITRFRQGWGRPDVRRLYDNRSALFYVDETDVLKDNESKAYAVDVASGAPDLRVTLVYIDRAGTTSSTLHRINDLSLRVTSPTGTRYWGNNGLTSGNYNWSDSGGVANTKDVVENVFVQNPQPGTWTIEVFADEVNMDTHPENGSSPPDADYALVATPVTTSGGCGVVNTIGLTGPSIAFTGATITFNYSTAPANAPFWMYFSNSLGGSLINGQCFDIGPNFKTGGTGTTSATGTGSWTSRPIPGWAAGITAYVEMRVDQGGTTFDSNYLTVDVF